jgi:hypothetical protein
MSAPVLSKLQQVGRKVVRWKASLITTWAVAIILAAVCVFGLIDFWLRLGRFDRFVTFTLLVILGGAALWRIGRVMKNAFTSEGVAAMVEEKFPQLDNHLINYLQFSKEAGEDPFKLAYVRSGAPNWQDLDFRKMRDARARKFSLLALGLAALVLVLPGLFIGPAWGVAVYRAVNPFTSMPPMSLTKIVKVEPGDITVLQGDPLVLTCAVEGFRTHEVRVDIDPGDADPMTYSLGRITSENRQEFSHRLAKVSTGLRYRFRAGDSPDSEWFTVATRPPSAFTGIQLAVQPPVYTGRPAATLNPREEPVVVPTGSTITATATCNAPLKSAVIRVAGGDKVWTISTEVTTGSAMRIQAVDTYGVSIEEDIAYSLEPDRAPQIEIVSPGPRTILPAGEVPRIEFRASDDYGLRGIAVEEVHPGTGTDKPGRQVEQWGSSGSPEFEMTWSGETGPRAGREIAYRVVAYDGRPDDPHRSVSPIVVFALPGLADAAKQRQEFEEKAFAGLQKVVELQKENISATDQLSRAKDAATRDAWTAVADRQAQIRELTHELLANPLKPLGGMTAKVKQLYVNEMVLAIDSLRSIPVATAQNRARHAREALALEKSILDQLTRAESAFAQAKVDRRISGISALLEALIRGQDSTLKQTRAFAENEAEVSDLLIDSQDALAEDLTGFVESCREEANGVRGNDAAFASTLDQIATMTEDLKIRNDMIIAAERLDGNKPGEAVPLQERALTNLKSLRSLINAVGLEREEERREALLEAVAQAKEKLAAIKKAYVEEKVEMMEEIRGAKDKNDEFYDTMEESYEELVKETRESLLEVPTDLHVFTDLNVANDLVEDVFSIFQEVEQQGHEDDPDGKQEVGEFAFAKEDVQLEMMEEAEGKLDDMEMWLGDTSDKEKTDTEAFDREEMPESGIATGALATEVEDMIGDLLEEDEEDEEQNQDSATTHAMPDMPMGWEVVEGDIASYAAKGKSGNERPDHHEQDGRSNVGRQGMSTGETAAGSGTISEGDENIEERRTEDPTQSGQIDLDGEADTKATGGGKLGTGKADDVGMSGGVERMDSNEAGSWEGMASLMAKQADAIYAKASLKNVRVDDLKKAAHHLRQSTDAVAKGDISQLKEHRKMAVSSLRRARSTLEAGPSGAMQVDGSAGVLDDVVESGPDHAPPKFRDQVADYYKALNDAL